MLPLDIDFLYAFRLLRRREDLAFTLQPISLEFSLDGNPQLQSKSRGRPEVYLEDHPRGVWLVVRRYKKPLKLFPKKPEGSTESGFWFGRDSTCLRLTYVRFLLLGGREISLPGEKATRGEGFDEARKPTIDQQKLATRVSGDFPHSSLGKKLEERRIEKSYISNTFPLRKRDTCAPRHHLFPLAHPKKSTQSHLEQGRRKVVAFY